MVCLVAFAAPASLTAAERHLDYRVYSMGDDLQAISRQIGVPVVDVTSTPATPGGVQELRWHARRGTAPSGDPVDRLVFSFYEHRLFRIVIDYTPDRTEGMTEADMVAAVSALYGAPIRQTLAVSGSTFAPTRAVETEIAQWTTGDLSVELLALQGRTAFRVIVVSTSLEIQARASGAREARVDRPDWPEIEAARARIASNAPPLQQLTRRANIASFIP
jgi:hypothetical protein